MFIGGEVLKSSAVAGIYVGRFCDMASITGILPIFYWRFLASVIWFFLVLLRVKHYGR